MTKIYSYIIPVDDGAAPNPYGGICTLTICKPKIRKAATENDSWIIGTGSKNTKLRDGFKYDFSKSLVYAMKVTDKKTLPEYDRYCQKHLKIKIPNWNNKNYAKKMGDCIYEYKMNNNPQQRIGIHEKDNKEKDTSGINSLLSNHFYYFGSEPKPIPKIFHKDLIHSTQGHIIIADEKLINKFEEWIFQFDRNRIYAEPQMKYIFEDMADEKFRAICSHKRLKNDRKDKPIYTK